VTALVDSQLRCVHFAHPQTAAQYEYDTNGRLSRSGSVADLRRTRSQGALSSGAITPGSCRLTPAGSLSEHAQPTAPLVPRWGGARGGSEMV
jgi:hypothetical protein